MNQIELFEAAKEIIENDVAETCSVFYHDVQMGAREALKMAIGAHGAEIAELFSGCPHESGLHVCWRCGAFRTNGVWVTLETARFLKANVTTALDCPRSSNIKYLFWNYLKNELGVVFHHSSDTVYWYQVGEIEDAGQALGWSAYDLIAPKLEQKK